MKHTFLRAVLLCTVVLAVFAFVQQGSAVAIQTPTITGTVVGQELEPFIFSPGIEEYEQEGKKWKAKFEEPHEGVLGGTTDVFIEEIEFDPDPIIYNNILVANNSGGTLTYQFDIVLATTWDAGPIRGSIDTSVIGGDALLQAPTGGSVYDARIDGVSVRTLQDDPFALGTAQSATSDFVDFSWEANAIPVTSDIGIRLTFSLSDGATAAILSDFEVIPEPASVAMISLAALGAVFVRRRFIA